MGRREAPLAGIAGPVAEFAAALRELRRAAGSPTYRQMALRAHYSAPSLAVAAGGSKLPTWELVRAYLVSCDVQDNSLQMRAWRDQWNFVRAFALSETRESIVTQQNSDPRNKLVTVATADPQRLGVRLAIHLEEGAVLSLYVPRDIDADLRTAVTASAKQGGIVVVEGAVSTGKTRSLFESVRAVLPNWNLVCPDNARALIVDMASYQTRTLVWCDDFERLTDVPIVELAPALGELVNRGLVLVGTALQGNPVTASSARTNDGENNKAIASPFFVVSMPARLSAAERRRAELLADDPRIRASLEIGDVTLINDPMPSGQPHR